jgi:hypothetical protein
MTKPATARFEHDFGIVPPTGIAFGRVDILAVLVSTGIAASMGEARRLLSDGAIRLTYSMLKDRRTVRWLRTVTKRRMAVEPGDTVAVGYSRIEIVARPYAWQQRLAIEAMGRLFDWFYDCFGDYGPQPSMLGTYP